MTTAIAPICTTRKARLPPLLGSTSTMVINADCASGLLLLSPPEKNQRNDQRGQEPLPIRCEELRHRPSRIRADMNGPSLDYCLQLSINLDVDGGRQFAVAALDRRDLPRPFSGGAAADHLLFLGIALNRETGSSQRCAHRRRDVEC